MGFYQLGLLAFLGVISVHGQSRVLFLGSDVIRPGTDYDATVSNLDIQIASFTVAIEDTSTRARVAQNTITIQPGSQETFSLQIPAELDETVKYAVRVTDGVLYDNSTEVRVEKKSRSIFIVTDKAIYKPGSNVFFRAFALNSDLRARVEPLSVEIFDPKGNKIKQWLNQPGEMGVVSGEHQLSTVTSLGDWKIKATSGGEDQTQTFKVDEYVLPKFEVEVSLNPSFIVSTNSIMSMTAKVTAMYTVGTPVDGDLTLTVKSRSSGVKPMVVSRKMSGVQNVDISFPPDHFVSCGICAMIVEATVLDSLSGEERTATTNFQTWRNKEKLEFLQGPKFIKPGLKSKFVLKITQQDGTPVDDPNGQITIDVTQNTDSKPTANLYTYPLPANGLLEVEYDILPQTVFLNLRATYNKVETSTSLREVFKTFSNQSIQVERDMAQNVPLNQIRFNVRSTEDISSLYYQVLSKKGVQAAGKQVLQTPGKSLLITLISSADFAPSATILVYYINSGNEVVATSQRFDVSLTFNKPMSMTWAEDRMKVNEEARLIVQAEAGSSIYVSAVDQSVLLLGESNDITNDRVTEELESYDRGKDQSCCGPVPFPGGRPRRQKRSFWFPFSDATDTAKVIESAGLVFMTDARVFRTPKFDVWLEDDIMQDAFGGRASTKIAQIPAQTEPYVRSFFPESWFWNQDMAGVDGRAEFKPVVPDTITKWVATSFALHPTFGLSIPPQRANLTAFIPFFMRVAKPYSVIRGEVVTLKVLVFNYLGSTRDVTVTLLSSPDFEVLDSPNSLMGESKTVSRSVQVLDQKGATVSFTIVPLKIDLISLNLRANTAGAADAIDDTLLVEPEGRLVEANRPIFIDLEGGQPFAASETISFPQDNVVEGSRMIKIKAIGDLLGTTLDGLQSLVRMPYGCGEQNMITFTPNIFVRKYYDRTGTLTAKVRADTTRFMEAGYERELTYQREDSSFSAFGDQDKSGSTWLTAFVIDSFKQAQPYIFVDDNVLINSLTWLLRAAYNEREGTFKEVGSVIHEEMQGGSLNTMTAYVLIALERCRDLNQSVPGLVEAINGARLNLENSVTTTTELYNLAIMGYALQLTGSSRFAATVLQKLEAEAQGAGTGMTYWKLTADTETVPCRSCHRPNNQVELAAFVLLTYVRRDDLTKALPIARYLMSQKNPSGGFYSTQDTVWGLNALAEFSAVTRSSGQNYKISVSAGPFLKKEFTITAPNSQVLQMYEIFDNQINGNTIQVNVDVAGTGAGLVEVSSRYFTTQEEASPKLKLEVGAVNKNDNVREVTSCITVLEKLNDMFVVELNDASGFPIDKNSIQPNDKNKIQRVEKDGKKTSIYYGDILPDQKYCITATAYKQDEVENFKAPMARAFAYYSGDETSVVYMKDQPGRDETSTLMSSTKPTDDSSRLQACVLTSVLLAFLALLFA